MLSTLFLKEYDEDDTGLQMISDDIRWLRADSCLGFSWPPRPPGTDANGLGLAVVDADGQLQPLCTWEDCLAAGLCFSQFFPEN